MSDFTELELKTEIADMDDEEAKKTLSDFMEAHQKNRTAYDELSSELDEVETEYQEKLEAKKEVISGFKQERAEEAAEHVEMPADLLAARFSFDEIEQIIEEAAEYNESDESDEEDDEDSALTTFAEREEKGETGGDGGYGSDRARELLGNKGFPAD